METHETAQSAPSPDAKRLRLHRSLEKVIGVDVADELIDFLPPSGWGDLVRKSDLEATERRLDSDIDALGARLDAKIDALGARLDAKIDALSQRVDAKIDALGARLDARIDALSQRVESLQEEVRRLGNLRSTIIITGLSLFVGLGSLMVAMFQVTGR
jgi:outer membrane murein-binding lipoprotein Lpp